MQTCPTFSKMLSSLSVALATSSGKMYSLIGLRGEPCTANSGIEPGRSGEGDPSAAVRLSGPSGPIRSCTRTRRRFRNRYRAARLASSGSVSNCCRVQKAADSALGLKLVGS